jgi:hypothetical protein
MNLSKSKYCRGIQCKKMLWLDEYKPNEAINIDNNDVLDNGSDVGELAKDLFGNHIDVKFSENLSLMIQDTNSLLKIKDVVITEASFKYENLFCSVDILRKIGNEVELYEVKSSTEIKDIYIHDISYQYYLLKKLGYNVKKAALVYINRYYEKVGKLDLKKLFIIKDVTDIVLEKESEVEENIKAFEECINDMEINDCIDIHCFKPYPCPYFKYCTKHLKSKNVFDLRRMTKKEMIKLYKSGIISFEQLKTSNIKDIYKRQIIYELDDKKDYIDTKNIKKFLDDLTEPLYFLDFETFEDSIPRFDYTKPYMQIPFQYSLHYIENGVLKHKEFLAESGTDPRRKLALQLVEDIPKNVCVLAYNMMFEKMIIKNLSELYPDLSEHLMNIYDNIKDLMIPFKEGYYYTKNMQGSYSIKYVLPSLFPNDPNLDYHNLDTVHNGSEAMNIFKKLENMDTNEKEKVRESLLKYCKLDTYAMVKIYNKLKEVIK